MPDVAPQQTRPGPWLVAIAATATITCALVVFAGALNLDIAHRALALVALPQLVGLALAARIAHPALRRPAYAALALFVVESAIGGLVSHDRGTASAVLHTTIAAGALAACVMCLAACFRGAPAPRAPWRDYVTLTKPRIMTLLLLTGACGMIIGNSGLPNAVLFTEAMVGLALACGGASAMNHLLDADIDRQMKRTANRPVASGRVAPSRALEFGMALSAASFALLAVSVNPLAAVLALAGNLFYVIVYTRFLKRSTTQNIVIGGAAGAVPPLVGWAAATGRLDLAAGLLFLIVFLWTPPHFWALALLIRKDYEDAGVPMLPVVRGAKVASDQILLYSLILVAATFVPVGISAWGIVYAISAAALGAWFIWLAWRLRQEPSHARSATLFHFSLLYLALLFVAAAVSVSV